MKSTVATILSVALLVCLGADTPRRTFDDVVQSHIDSDKVGYFDIPRSRLDRKRWMLERARSMRDNCDSVIYALEHGAMRDSTREALIDNAAICKRILMADQHGTVK